jgi:hypothetical protein
MFWELSGDKPIESGQSIVHATVAGFQAGLERRENELDYSASRESVRVRVRVRV